jgi:hypothetical protein
VVPTGVGLNKTEIRETYEKKRLRNGGNGEKGKG